MTTTRRIMLALALLPAAAATGADALGDAIREAVGDGPITDGGIVLRAPATAENGGQVPITILAESPMTAADHVTAIHVFATAIRTLIEHPMETGLRQDGPRRDMLTRLLVRMNAETVLAAEFRNGTAANPYHVFFVRMDRTSTFDFTWTDEAGRSARVEARVSVS